MFFKKAIAHPERVSKLNRTFHLPVSKWQIFCAMGKMPIRCNFVGTTAYDKNPWFCCQGIKIQTLAERKTHIDD
ncbi:hypothetical protein NDI39_02845 [Microcoleus sp. ZQ-A2]|nr:hypothetical protein [Microcoleus sp. FACHB-1]